MEDAVKQHLESISTTFTEATVRSHRTTLQAFRQYCNNQGLTQEELTPKQAALFLLTTGESKAPSTVRGEVSILGRFLAGFWNTTPEIATNRIKTAINHQTTNELQDSQQGSTNDHKQVEEFIKRLRQRDFGSRAHIIVELILETGARLRDIQQTNLDTFYRESGTITLQSSEKYTGQTQVRTENLSEETVRPLCTYIDYERYSVPDENPEPLVTTKSGRATTDTLRRSIKQASKSHSQNPDSIVTPINVRRFALSRK